MRILIVEDDQLQLEDIRHAMRTRYPDAELLEIRTEQEFRQRLDDTAADPPDIIILDVMIRWIRRGKSSSPNPYDTSQNAGFRCARLLDDRGIRVPIIFVTMLDRKDFDSEVPNRNGVVILQKEASFEKLIRQIDRLVPNDS